MTSLVNPSNTLKNHVIKNMCKCLQGGVINVCPSCGYEQKVLYTCGLKCCTKCSDRRTYALVKKYSKLSKLYSDPKLLTLTFKDHLPLTKVHSKYVRSRFREFIRRLKNPTDEFHLKRYYVKSSGWWYVREVDLDGLYTIEIKRKSDGFYYHIHALVQSSFVPQEYFSDVWYAVTGDSMVVDVRSVSFQVGLEYVLKYVSKPMKDIRISEYITFFRNNRLFMLFGKFHFWKKELIHLLVIRFRLTRGQAERELFPKRYPVCPMCGDCLVYFTTRFTMSIEKLMMDESYYKPPLKSLPFGQFTLDSFI